MYLLFLVLCVLTQSFCTRFVSFASEEEANAAIERLNGCQAGQSTLRVTKAIPREKPLGLSGPTAESKVHIVNIPLQMSQVFEISQH